SPWAWIATRRACASVSLRRAGAITAGALGAGPVPAGSILVAPFVVEPCVAEPFVVTAAVSQQAPTGGACRDAAPQLAACSACSVGSVCVVALRRMTP